jgi:hypothetical protein
MRAGVAEAAQEENTFAETLIVECAVADQAGREANDNARRLVERMAMVVLIRAPG